MNSSSKLILGILIGLMLACAGGGALLYGLVRTTGTALANKLDTETEKVAAVAAKIAGFDLPAGYREQYAADFAGFSLAAYTADDPSCHLFLIQAPKYLRFDAADLELTLKQATDRPDKGWEARMKVLSLTEMDIRGQAVMVRISEGTNSEGRLYREATAVFEGRGGQALVTLSAPLSAWDEAAVTEFLTSLR